MSTLILTAHAAMRIAQRSIPLKDAELIFLIGTEVDDGYLVREKDYQEVERQLKIFLERCWRMVGKRLVTAEGRIVTAYHPSKKHAQRLLRNAYDSDLRNDKAV
jgi:hypothetical protein